VSDAIRAPEMGEGASKVSAHPEVRAALLDLQRQLGGGGGVVLEGRDIGSVVFPDAEVKFFLSASVGVRAKRRYDELVEKGTDVTLEDVEAEVEERDNRDRNRPVAPLVEPKGAILVDSSKLTIRQVVAEMADFVNEVVRKMPRV
jgi:CMP/dCMP kinase